MFSNEEEFEKKIKPKLKGQTENLEVNPKQFEILLYSLRICLKTTYHNNPKDFLYSHIILNNEEKIKENCLPGNNLINDHKVICFYEIEKHLKSKADNVGAYVCSCGEYYEIPPCGFPVKDEQETLCPNCKLKIGYAPKPERIPGKHGMVIREGHYRIFKNQKQKKEQMEYHKNTDKNIPNMLLDDYKTKVIDPIIKHSIFGINQVTKIRFEQNIHKIRNLSTIGYRLLNFILYSHLFFSNCLGYIDYENMNKYTCEG